MITLKKIQESDGRKGFFLKYFFSYLAIFSIPLFLAFFTYNTAANIISAQCSNQVTKMLQQTRDITDVKLKELESMALTIKNSESIMAFHQKWANPDSTGDIFSAYKAIRSIPKYELINSSVDNTRLFFGKESCCFIIEEDNAFRHTQNLNELYWDETDLSYQNIIENLRNTHFYEQFVAIPTNNPLTQNVYFLSNMNAFYQEDYSAVVVIKLSNEFFSDMLHNITLDDCGTSFILTEENQMISYYQGKNSFEISEEDLSKIVELGTPDNAADFFYKGNQINMIHSGYNDWTYYSLIPQEVIFQDLTAMRQLIAIVTCIVVMMGIFGCYLLTKRNSKPMKNIISALTSVYEYGYFDSTDHFKFLENAVSALVDRNSSYQQMLDNEILRMLFLGEYTNSKELEEKLIQSSISLEDNLFITICLHIHNLRDSEKLTPQTFTKCLTDAFCGNIYSIIIDESNMLFLAVQNGDLTDRTFPIYLKGILTNLGNDILRETNCHLDFFLSEPMRYYKNVSRSYEQCKKIALSVYKKSDVFVYTLEDLPPFQQLYHYTIEQEIELTQLIQHGSTEKLQNFLDALYKENFDTLLLSDGMKQDFIGAIQKGVRRNLSFFQENARISKIFSEFVSDNTIEKLYYLLFDLKDAVQEHIRMSAKADSDQTKHNILDYIQKNFGNQDLNLYYMCQDLGISEQTASKFFQELGSSFSVFLEKVRIEAACMLLADNVLTIKVISEKVGYSSDASFRRAFKRVLGISPSSYIKNNYTLPNDQQ